MSKIEIKFNQGIQKPAQLGTVILKPTAGGKLSYAQNIWTIGQEYGEGVLTPGPDLTTLTNNDDLTGVPIGYAKSRTANVIVFIEGILGATNVVRSVNQVTAGSTPQVEDGVSETIDHTSHTGEILKDILARDDDIYILGEDATDGWVQKDAFTGGVFSFSAVQTLSSYAAGHATMIKASDNNLYILHGRLVDTLDASDTYAPAAFTLPVGYMGTDLAEWNGVMAFAYHVGKITGIANRKEKGRAGILLWDMIATANFIRDISCPSNYISAMVNKPDGNLIVFGSLRNGMTTIYQFTGYGFQEITSYIGEPPRNRHSVDFDNEGRLFWQTLDGQVCMYDFTQGKFEHITSITASSGNGGILTSLLGSTGNEWLIGAGKSGSPNTFTIAKTNYANYIGDGNASTDDTTTPLAISGQEFLPDKSTITAITLHLSRELTTSEKLVLRLYKNGNTTSTDYLTMEYSSAEPAISSKREVKSVPGVSNFALGLAFKQTDGLASAPPVVTAIVEYETTL